MRFALIIRYELTVKFRFNPRCGSVFAVVLVCGLINKVNTDDKQRYKAQLLVLQLGYYFDDNKNYKYYFSDVMLVPVDPTYNLLMVKDLLWYVLHLYK